MRSNHIITLVVAVSLGVGSLVFAGCGGGGSKNSVAPVNDAKASGKQTKRTSEDDCRSLGRLTSDIALAATGFDYVADRDFVDGYADRAPDEIADSVRRLRDIFDTFASAAEKAGLQPNDVPLPDQADEIMNSLTYSEDEQADNARAFETVDAWVMNGCGS
jgi:hypothetical protein